MKARTFIFALLLGFIGMQVFGLINWPDGGTVIAIAYVGSEIVGALTNKEYNGDE